MYGNTESVAEKTATLLSEAGVKDVRCYDVSATHVSYLISESFRCSHIVLAAPTYNGGVFTPMENFLVDLKAHGLQKRSFAIIENGTWGPVAGCKMRSMVEEMKDMKVLESTLTVRSSMKENQIAMLEEMVKEVVEDLNK
jgi:flavorubredoxin